MDRAELINQLKRDEGFRSKPYRCTAGKWTIGYGRNLDDVGISEQEAAALLAGDINQVETQLQSIPVYQELNAVRQTALANMAFNLGMPRLMKFKRMWQALEDQNFKQAAVEMMDSRWADQVGIRAVRLADQMARGDF